MMKTSRTWFFVCVFILLSPVAGLNLLIRMRIRTSFIYAFLTALLAMVLTQMLTRGLRSQVARSFSTGGVPRKVLITGPPGGGA